MARKPLTTLKADAGLLGPRPSWSQLLAVLIRYDQVRNVRAPVILHQHISTTINCGQDARGPKQPQL
jgi:hypothetical protein